MFEFRKKAKKLSELKKQEPARQEMRDRLKQMQERLDKVLREMQAQKPDPKPE